MTLSIEINERPFQNFRKIEVRANLDTASRSFSFEANSDDLTGYPIKAGDQIIIRADGEKVLTGFVDRIGIRYNITNHIISVTGRSKTSDFIDSTLESFTLNAGTLFDVVKDIILKIGADIDVIEEEKDLGLFKISEITDAEDGENAFMFAEKYARRRQALLTDNANGDIVITRNTGIAEGGFILSQKITSPNAINNIKDVNFSLDISNRFNKYIVKSQQSTIGINAIGGNTSPEDVSLQSGNSTDDKIRTGRQLVFTTDTAMDNENSQNRANWQANINRARSMRVDVTLEGHSAPNGAPFDINRLVLYDDDYTGINSLMLIDGFIMTYGQGENEGSETRLRLLVPDAYLPDPTPTADNEVANPLL